VGGLWASVKHVISLQCTYTGEWSGYMVRLSSDVGVKYLFEFQHINDSMIPGIIACSSCSVLDITKIIHGSVGAVRKLVGGHKV
jgi:hypothetical protein